MAMWVRANAEVKYQAVIFDLFGTLIPTFSIDANRRSLLKIAKVLLAPHGQLTEVWEEFRSIRENGSMPTTESYIEYISGQIGIHPDTNQIAAAALERREFIRRILVPRVDSISLLIGLRDTDHKVGLISDCTPDVPAVWPETPFAAVIEHPVFSCEAGMMKPDRRIFELACQRLQVNPQDCLYIGDGGSYELTGALAVGMHPVLLRVPTEASDAYRPGAEEWDGTTIATLAEVSNLVED